VAPRFIFCFSCRVELSLDRVARAPASSAERHADLPFPGMLCDSNATACTSVQIEQSMSWWSYNTPQLTGYKHTCGQDNGPVALQRTPGAAANDTGTDVGHDQAWECERRPPA
jgi:hypothetical protein